MASLYPEIAQCCRGFRHILLLLQIAYNVPTTDYNKFAGTPSDL